MCVLMAADDASPVLDVPDDGGAELGHQHVVVEAEQGVSDGVSDRSSKANTAVTSASNW